MAIVVTIIGALRSFDLISVMTGGGPFESSTVLAYYMYDQAIKYYRIGYSAAVAGIRIVKSLFFAPFVLSGVVVGLIFSWFYDPTFGLLALILGHGVPVLGDPRYATFGIVFAALWPQTAYCMILYLTGLTSLNAEQIEAARMEGARGWSMLWHVILPQLRPTTFMAIVVTIIGALRSFDLISVMTGGGPFESSTVLAYYMYDQAIKYYRIGYSAAVAVVLFGIMLVYIVYHLRRMLRTEQ